MSVVVAEYLGVRTDRGDNIKPIKVSKDKSAPKKPILPCPFRNSLCDKAKRGDKPICSLRDSKTGELWISCPHRFCASEPKKSTLNEHQRNILWTLAQTLYSGNLKEEDIIYKREVPIEVTDESDYKADYVIGWTQATLRSHLNPFSSLILEMQGGGETTNTGVLTKHVDEWENLPSPTNEYLVRPVKKVSPLVTNAWRRQQEQFLIKGNVAILTGGRMAFCVGSLIYDYLLKRLKNTTLPDLRNANWTLAFLGIIEDQEGKSPACAPHSIPLKIDPQRVLFTNYSTFIQGLTNQAAPSESLFTGTYEILAGGLLTS